MNHAVYLLVIAVVGLTLGQTSNSSIVVPPKVTHSVPANYVGCPKLPKGVRVSTLVSLVVRASVSKRTLYAHFESKEKLYLDVVGLVRGLLLKRLKSPEEYSENTTEAITRFCGRFLEILLYAKTIQMCRVCIAEAERFPEGSGQYYETVFSEAQAQLSRYMQAHLGLSQLKSTRAAERLLAQVIYPRFHRALFGLDALREHLDDDPSPDFDLKTIRAQVVDSQR